MEVWLILWSKDIFAGTGISTHNLPTKIQADIVSPNLVDTDLCGPISCQSTIAMFTGKLAQSYDNRLATASLIAQNYQDITVILGEAWNEGSNTKQEHNSIF